jgi:5-dehydro-2-deoxygluconokinase
MWDGQIATIRRLFAASRRNRLEFLLEVIPSKVGPVGEDTTPAIIQRFYDAGVFPDWWKLEPFATDGAWANACAAIERNDPDTRGIVVLGLDAPVPALEASFARAARHRLVKGFAVGRTIFGDPARRWMAGTLGDEEAVDEMSRRFASLAAAWDRARAMSERAA